MKHNIVFIGLDTHKDFHEVAYVEEQRGAEVIHQGRINGSKVAIHKWYVSLSLNIRTPPFTLPMKQAPVAIGFIA